MARKNAEAKRADVIAAMPTNGSRISHNALIAALEGAGKGESAEAIFNLNQARVLTTEVVMAEDGTVTLYYSNPAVTAPAAPVMPAATPTVKPV